MELAALRDLYVDLRSGKREGETLATQPTAKKKKTTKTLGLGSSSSAGKQATLQGFFSQKKDKEKKKGEEGENNNEGEEEHGSQRVQLAEVERRACLQALRYARQKKKAIEALSGPSEPLIVTLVCLGWSRILYRTWQMEEAVALK